MRKQPKENKIFSDAAMVGARQRYEARLKQERDARVARSRQLMPNLMRPLGEFSLPVRRMIALGGILVVAAGVKVAESPTTTAYVNSKLHELGQIFQGESTPTPEDATTITVGDTIRFKTKDGKVEKREVRFLSDITAAAKEVDPSINYNDFDDMLDRQNGNSNLVHPGQTKVRIDQSLGITDVGPSGEDG
jgi:hypothetical protein